MVHRYRAGGSRENKVDRTKCFSLILSAWLGGEYCTGLVVVFHGSAARFYNIFVF